MPRGSRRNRSGRKRPRTEKSTATPSVRVAWWKRIEIANSTDSTSKQIPTRALPQPWTLEELEKDHPWWKLAKRHGWKTPTPIQLHAWSILSSSKNYSCVLISPTGSGKTLAYGLCRNNEHPAKMLVLVPTRELALQVAKQQPWKHAAMVCVGGDRSASQFDPTALCHAKMIAATPGRLLAALKQHTSVLSHLRTVDRLVLDEADRLALSKDLYEQVQETWGLLVESNNKKSIQMVLCSATWPAAVTPVWSKWLREDASQCVQVTVDALSIVSHSNADRCATKDVAANEEQTNISKETASGVQQLAQTRDLFLSKIPSNLTQILHVCAEHKKPKKLLTTLQKVLHHQEGKRHRALGIVFCAKIKTVQFVANFLSSHSTNCAPLHSQLPQSARAQIVQNFAAGKTPLLVATDIAARGVHVKHVQYIIQYDVSTNLEQYVHRCGRAGRSAENTAVAYSFFTRNLAPLAADMVALLESCQQHVDPNLRALIPSVQKGEAVVSVENDMAGKLKNDADNSDASDEDQDVKDPSEPRIVLKTATGASGASDHNDSGDEDIDFRDLSAKRVVLKRALDVSDASGDDDSG